MGRRIVSVEPELFADIITQGHIVGGARIIQTIHGVPADAVFLRCWFEHGIAERGRICFLFQHPEWSATPEGKMYEELYVMTRSIRLAEADQALAS